MNKDDLLKQYKKLNKLIELKERENDELRLMVFYSDSTVVIYEAYLIFMSNIRKIKELKSICKNIKKELNLY